MTLAPAQLVRGLVIVAALAAWAWIAHSSSADGALASHGATALGLSPLALAVALVVWRLPHPAAQAGGFLAMAGGIAWAWPLLRQNVHTLYFLQHAGTNLALAVLFGRTLLGQGEPLVTRMARIVHQGVLSPAQLRHTRHSTVAWTCFFLANAVISAGLYGFAPLAAWSTFANLLAFPLLVAMFAAEHLWRRFALPPQDRPNIAQVIQAYRLSQQPPSRAPDSKP